MTSIKAVNERQTHSLSPFYTDENGFISLKDQSANILVENSVVQVKPWSGFSPTCFQSSPGFQLQFDMSNSQVDIWERLALRMLLSNSDGTNAATLVPSYFLFQYLQIFINDTLVDQIYSSQMYEDEVLLSKYVTVQKEGNVAGFDPSTYSSNLVIPAAGSLEVFMPIKTFLGSLELMPDLWGSSTAIRLIFFCNAGSSLYSAGSGSISTITLTDTDMRIDGANFKNDTDRAQMVNDFANNTHQYKLITHQYYPLNTNSLSAGTQYQINMTISASQAAGISLFPTNVNPSVVQWNPLQLEAWNLLDGGGQSLVGLPQGTNMSDRFSRYWMNNLWLDNLVNNTQYIYPFSWADDLSLTYRSGINTGSIEILPSYRVLVQPAASQAYNLQINVWVYTLLTITPDGGVVVNK
jgi:hypothetical protein